MNRDREMGIIEGLEMAAMMDFKIQSGESSFEALCRVIVDEADKRRASLGDANGS